MSSAGWKDIKHKYFLATGLVHEREQFNSKVQELKAEWRLCNSLRKSSGLGGSGYNVYADDDWWEKESKVPANSLRFSIQAYSCSLTIVQFLL
jgi:hypothetical protein